MNRTQLVAVRVIGDLLGVVTSLIPGINLLVVVPVFMLHFRFAGPRALITLAEGAPLVGALPIFTIAALSYPNPIEVSAVSRRDRVPVRPVPVLPNGVASTIDSTLSDEA